MIHGLDNFRFYCTVAYTRVKGIVFHDCATRHQLRCMVLTPQGRAVAQAWIEHLTTVQSSCTDLRGGLLLQIGLAVIIYSSRIFLIGENLSLPQTVRLK